jgi:hypothetical protein
MAIQIDSLDITGLRKTHFNQLREYIHMRDSEGWYYGPREQFEKRHNDLLEWIENVCELVNQNDIKIKDNK